MTSPDHSEALKKVSAALVACARLFGDVQVGYRSKPNNENNFGPAESKQQ